MYKIIGVDGREYGPVSAEQLRQWIAEGRANAQTKAQAEGSTDWKPLSEFPGFGAQPGGEAPPPPLSAPPQPPHAATPQSQPKIATYLPQAILCTLFCCLPFGIPAIVYAAQVNTKLAAGDIAGALNASRKAKGWCWASVAGWVLTILFYVILFLALGMHPRRWR